MSDATARDALCALGRSLFERGLTHGSTGNLSARIDEGFLLTPTGSSLGTLDPARLARLDVHGVHVRGDAPTKEAMLHLAMYAGRPQDRAIVHLHSTHSVAVSVLADVDPADAIEELEATAKLWLLVRQERVRLLTREQQLELAKRYPR